MTHPGTTSDRSTPMLPAPDVEIAVFSSAADATAEDVVANLRHASQQVRRRAIQTVHTAGLGHIGGEYSVTDILVTLYLHTMNISPRQVESNDNERDRLVLSKGHTANTLYTVLAAGGYLEADSLRTFVQGGSQLNGHPARTKIKAVEASTGPLGHGLPIAVGMAVAAQLDGSPRRTFVVLGDGEMQEGSNWEAIMTAGHKGLSNLCAIIDRNRLQQGARVQATNNLEPLSDKLIAFGWSVVEVDGHDHAGLIDAFAQAAANSERPTAVIAHTDKGYPVSYMRDEVAWHHKVPNEEQLRIALSELDAHTTKEVA